MKVTEVMPAVAPQRSRRAGERGSPGEASKNCGARQLLAHAGSIHLHLSSGHASTYPLVEVVAAELHRAVGHDAYAVGAVARHHTLEALLSPDLPQRLTDAHLVLGPAAGLDLQQDL